MPVATNAARTQAARAQDTVIPTMSRTPIRMARAMGCANCSANVPRSRRRTPWSTAPRCRFSTKAGMARQAITSSGASRGSCITSSATGPANTNRPTAAMTTQRPGDDEREPHIGAGDVRLAASNCRRGEADERCVEPDRREGGHQRGDPDGEVVQAIAVGVQRAGEDDRQGEPDAPGEELPGEQRATATGDGENAVVRIARRRWR